MSDPGPVIDLRRSGLRVCLLGPPATMWAGQSLTIPRRQARALLFRLAAEMRPVPRELLCALFWPDSPDSTARRELTRLLTHLRRALPQGDLVLAADDSLALNAQRAWTDAVAFRQLSPTAAKLPGPALSPAQRSASLAATVQLYRGPFLSGFSLPRNPEFEAWATQERQLHERLYLELLERQIEDDALGGNLSRAIDSAERYLAIDELAESIYRRLMLLYLRAGDRPAALRLYERCLLVFERELNVDPLPATQAVYEGLLAGRPPEEFERESDRSSAGQPTRAALPGAVAPAPHRPNNLPATMSHFLGRAREIAEIRRLLENTRLLTLTGAGGSGKSRLALAVTGELVGTYAQGAWWAELAGLSNPALVPQTVAFALGVREQPGRAITETLSDYLCAKELLLVLDNCEHLLDACAQLAETLLRSCPRLHILATSRQALGLAGEIAWLVPGLAVPGAETRAATASEMLRALAETEAVQLFIDRAAGAQPGFRLTAANAAAVGQVCQRLDGLPLAIELAATWVKVLAVEEIACRLDDSLRLLTGGHRTALPRHQTLRATIDWSYVRLPPAEQTLLRRLSVFAGGFSLNAAETVCADAQAVAVRAGPNGQPAVTPRDNVLGLLSNLVTKSLVDVQPADGETRYRLLETIRQYAEERLEESGEPERIRDRHTDFFLAFAEDAEPKLRSAQQAVWLQHLEAEHDNLRAALRRAATAGPVERALRLAAALAWFWYLHHDWREGRDWLVAILSRLPEGGPLPAAHGAASLGAGILCWIVGDHDSAASWLETSEALARQGGDRRGLAYARLYLGVVARTRSDHARSRALFNEAVALFRAVADPWGLGFALFCLGRATHGQGDNVTARACFEESLTCFRQTGDKWGLTLPFGGLAFVAQSQARYHEAAELLEQSIAIARELRDTQTVAWSLLSLGDVARCSGDYRRAGGLYGEALNLHRDLGLEYGIADTLQNLGWVALHDQDMARARACFEEALDLYQASGNQAALLQCVAGQAGVAVIQHRPTQAAQLFGAAEALLEALETVLAAAEQAEWTHYVAQARAMLSAEEFAAAWAEGRSLSLAQAIASAYPRDRAALGQQTRTARHAAAEIRRGPRYPAGLTAREVEVLGQVASGLTDAQVAQRLVISPRTVSTHLSAIYRKLGVTTRSEAAHFAAGHGLI